MRDLQYKAISNYHLTKESGEKRAETGSDMISYMNDSQIEAMKRPTTKGIPGHEFGDKFSPPFCLDSCAVSLDGIVICPTYLFHSHQI